MSMIQEDIQKIYPDSKLVTGIFNYRDYHSSIINTRYIGIISRGMLYCVFRSGGFKKGNFKHRYFKEKKFVFKIYIHDARIKKLTMHYWRNITLSNELVNFLISR